MPRTHHAGIPPLQTPPPTAAPATAEGQPDLGGIRTSRPGQRRARNGSGFWIVIVCPTRGQTAYVINSRAVASSATQPVPAITSTSRQLQKAAETQYLKAQTQETWRRKGPKAGRPRRQGDPETQRAQFPNPWRQQTQSPRAPETKTPSIVPAAN